MKKRILFYAANNGQINNMRPLLSELKKRNYQVAIYDTSQIYHQHILFDGFEEVVDSPFILDKSFYRCSVIEKLKFVNSIRKQLRNVVDSFDILIVAADGSLERVLINEFRKQKKQTMMLLDGIISDYSISFKDGVSHPAVLLNILKQTTAILIKRIVFDCFKTTSLSPFLPGKIGMMPLDKILVIGEHSKRCVEKYNKHSKVIASGLPRLYNQKVIKTERECSSTYVCYFPSAFKWHGLDEDDKNQHRDIEIVCETIDHIRSKNNVDVRLVIKMHPREVKSDYDCYLTEYEFVSVVEDVSITDCFKNYDLFLSNVSTVIIEGLINQIRVYSLMINFQYWKFKYSFLSSDEISKVFSKDELNNLIVSCIKGDNCYKIENIGNSLLFENNCSPKDVVTKLLSDE